MKPSAIVTLLVLSLSHAAPAGLKVDRDDQAVTVRGGHFLVTIDGKTGGELSEVKLFDGADWNSLFGDSGITFPLIKLSGGGVEYGPFNDRGGKIVDVRADPNLVRVRTRSIARARNGAATPWEVALGYEIHVEGAVFIDMELRLRDKPFEMSEASASLMVCQAIAEAPHSMNKNLSNTGGGLPSGRVAFGMSDHPHTSFTNEVEAIVEHNRAMAGTTARHASANRIKWVLGQRAKLPAGFHYTNRIALALGAAEIGKPQTNAIGHRVYHWVNFLNPDDWYPTNAQIDTMVADHGTMLILHHEYMLQRGTNGHPHADYGVARDHAEMVRCIDYAHRKGLRVGLYMRGVEPYALQTGWFDKYCKRNWDGIYVDWHGPQAVSWHDNRYAPEPALGDKHYSRRGTHVPARDYFLFTKRLRETVGPKGFLIGHQGTFNSGVLSNLCFDAFLPGEAGSDRRMLSSLDEAAYKGMLGGVACMPWMLDLPLYRNAEGAAKLAAWGLYPHLVTGIRARHTKGLTLPIDPAAPIYDFVQPYWRVLAKVDVEDLRAFNSPAVNRRVVASSDTSVRSMVYKARDGRILVIAANLRKESGQATLRLDTGALGMEGTWQVRRIDSLTGQTEPAGTSSGELQTSKLSAWGIEGFLLEKR